MRVKMMTPCRRIRSTIEKHLLPMLLLLTMLLVNACATNVSTPPLFEVQDGDPERGLQVFEEYGCHTCHAIPGVQRADSYVGPPLDRYAQRAFVGGVAPNIPSNLIRWIQSPQALNPDSAMPSLGVTESDARDMAAYLYTLR